MLSGEFRIADLHSKLGIRNSEFVVPFSRCRYGSLSGRERLPRDSLLSLMVSYIQTYVAWMWLHFIGDVFPNGGWLDAERPGVRCHRDRGNETYLLVGSALRIRLRKSSTFGDPVSWVLATFGRS